VSGSQVSALNDDRFGMILRLSRPRRRQATFHLTPDEGKGKRKRKGEKGKRKREEMMKEKAGTRRKGFMARTSPVEMLVAARKFIMEPARYGPLP
jgi:hypothetical protein